MASRAAIVTGGAGFIGSHVVDSLLQDGYAVTVIDDLSSGSAQRVAEGARLVELDIVEGERVRELVREVSPEAVFHLAAQASVTASVQNPRRDCEVNVKGTLNVVEAANGMGVPVVFTSTGGALYGDEAPMPTGEEREPAPLSPYGASKWAGEAYVKTWSLSSGVANAVTRLGNVYGPRQNPHGEAGVVAIFAHKLYAEERPKLYGHGRPTRDYVYVADVVSALRRAAGRRGTYNIATGVQSDVMSLWERLREIAGKRIEPQLEDLRPGELQHSCLDVSRAQRELDWRAEVAIEEGLRQTYEALVAEFAAA
ncbi:MAG TPA: NAD-dependent epimerase/dehydratase family protein [Solirubrobacteraceae bacterium]|nr:NAD-dependent epimerase/dehydratase family protein [Solirubrobacteraceae bacterium]